MKKRLLSTIIFLSIIMLSNIREVHTPSSDMQYLIYDPTLYWTEED